MPAQHALQALASEAVTGRAQYASRAVAAQPAAFAVVALAAVAAAVLPVDSHVRPVAVLVEQHVQLVAPDARGVPAAELDVPAFAPAVQRVPLVAQPVSQVVPSVALPAGGHCYQAAHSALPHAALHARVDHHGCL